MKNFHCSIQSEITAFKWYTGQNWWEVSCVVYNFRCMSALNVRTLARHLPVMIITASYLDLLLIVKYRMSRIHPKFSVFLLLFIACVFVCFFPASSLAFSLIKSHSLILGWNSEIGMRNFELLSRGNELEGKIRVLAVITCSDAKTIRYRRPVHVTTLYWYGSLTGLKLSGCEHSQTTEIHILMRWW